MIDVTSSDSPIKLMIILPFEVDKVDWTKLLPQIGRQSLSKKIPVYLSEHSRAGPRMLPTISLGLLLKILTDL